MAVDVIREGNPVSRPPPRRVVLDTSVLVASAHSREGASFAILSSIPSPHFIPCLSVGLYIEWQAVLTREDHLHPGRTATDALAYLRYLASQCHLQEVHFLWRPALADADDDMLLELAVASGARHIITHNVDDFAGADRFGVLPILPGDFLRLIRSQP